MEFSEKNKIEVQNSTTVISREDLVKSKQVKEEFAQWQAKYFREREALMNELEQLAAKLFSYGIPS
jgi:hypothetical protein